MNQNQVFTSSGIGNEETAMDVFQFIQIVGFALAFFLAGCSVGKRK